jgi:hypothetical protein
VPAICFVCYRFSGTGCGIWSIHRKPQRRLLEPDGSDVRPRVQRPFGTSPVSLLSRESAVSAWFMCSRSASPISTLASSRLSKRQALSKSSRSRPLNDSIQAFCHGEQGSMKTELKSLKRHHFYFGF